MASEREHNAPPNGEADRPLGKGESAEKPMETSRAAHRGPEPRREECFTGAEIGALAHLYRGEIYRSTTWRTRLDATTNWSVVSLGVALSISYSSVNASALPLLLVGVLITVFLFLEARRYRYFNVWRARARWLEINFYAPLLMRESYEDEGRWQKRLAEDYRRPEHHISFLRAFGRRLRRNYLWIFTVQGLAYFGKIIIHPAPLESVGGFFDRMVVGPAPGWLVMIAGVAFYSTIAGATVSVYLSDQKRIREQPNPISMG
ncbi:MAG: DUF2270 domain-containing protein [Pseudomonadota bacterium]